MIEGALAWGLAVLGLAVAGSALVWRRRRIAALVAARDADRRAALAAEKRFVAENCALAARLAGAEADLAALRGVHEPLVDMLDRLPVPLWRRGADLALVYCNRAYADAVEADRARVLAEGLPLGGPALAGRMRALAELALTARTPQSEADHVVIAGSRRLLDFTEAPVADGGTVGMAIDVTEREEAEAELSRHVAAHGGVLETLTTAIAIFGPDRRLKFYNTAYARLWKIEEGWLRGEPEHGELMETLRERRRLPEFVDFQAFKRNRLALFTSLLEPLEELIYLPDGTTLRTRTMPHPLGGLMFTFEDVTDNLVLERSYNTLIAVQRATLDNLYEGVAVLGSDGRLRLTNPAYARIWQLPAEALSAEPHIADLVERTRDFFDYDDWSGFKERLISRMTDRKPRAGRLARTDGSVLDYASVPLPDGATLLSYVDVTDSIRVERALRERAEGLEAADRLKSEFISTVSYELRTPLNTIIGFAEILANLYFGPLNERQLEYSRGIIVSSERLLTIINDILDLASIEAGRMELARRPIAPHALLADVASVMRDMARSQNLRLDIDVAADMQPIEGDERRVKQALCNLVSNAIKFTPAGGSITLSARIENGRAVIAVADTGVGIAVEDQERVFKEFERGRPGEGQRTGPGLGLALVKRIVELHGGSVTIESAPNRGTIVTCALPTQAH